MFSMAVSICPTLALGMTCATAAVEIVAAANRVVECMLRDDYALRRDIYRWKKGKDETAIANVKGLCESWKTGCSKGEGV